jgi:hypothetical protein
VAIDDVGKIAVRFQGSNRSVPAKLLSTIGDSSLREALDLQREALVLLEDGDPRRPIVIGRQEGGARAASGHRRSYRTAMTRQGAYGIRALSSLPASDPE